MESMSGRTDAYGQCAELNGRLCNECIWERGRLGNREGEKNSNVQGHTQCVVKYVSNLLDLFQLKPSGTVES